MLKLFIPENALPFQFSLMSISSLPFRTEIQWLPGKNLTQKILKKKPKKGSKDTKPITKVENCESFFLFFDPPQLPEDEEELEEETVSFLDRMPLQYLRITLQILILC